MELFLNILWMLIALGGVTVWRLRWARQAHLRRHAPWCEWTALVCALVLLFFVVSLTDDLHAELIVLEDCCTSRRHVNCLSAAHNSQHPQHFSPGLVHAAIPASAHFADFAFEPLYIPVSNSSYVAAGPSNRLGRAPPVAL
ncbi:MAG: hypothetical protein WA192_12505 [Candidatus Acidiferrales bacterium]